MVFGASRLFRARMGAVVDLGDLGCGELGVALGGGEAFVAEEFLDGAEVCAFFEHVGSEGVAEGVGMGFVGQSVGDGEGFDDAADAAGGEAGVAACSGANAGVEQECGAGFFCLG